MWVLPLAALDAVFFLWGALDFTWAVRETLRRRSARRAR
jgi:hypothetical protein